MSDEGKTGEAIGRSVAFSRLILSCLGMDEGLLFADFGIWNERVILEGEWCLCALIPEYAEVLLFVPGLEWPDLENDEFEVSCIRDCLFPVFC